jgi:UDP-N-acetylglucosamine 2-epimerase (non-hydrolysing)
MQEEAPALGIPLLILRERTERPEGITSGNALLVGKDPQLIRDTTNRLLDDAVSLASMARPAFPYGEGRAADRIAVVIAEWLAMTIRESEAGRRTTGKASVLGPLHAEVERIL